MSDEHGGQNGDPVGGINMEVSEVKSRVVLWGEIDGALRSEASGVLASALERELPVVIDLESVTFMDSTGIAFLVQFCTIGADEGIDVVVRKPPQLVRDVIEMLGIAELLGLTRDPAPEGRTTLAS